MSQFIDLHMHTTHSDGICNPARILDIVREKNLAAFSVTDHDTLEGYREMLGLLGESDPELIAGVELSVTVESVDLHMLAYLFDPDNVQLTASLADFQNKRNQRGRLIVEKLNDMGLDLDYDLVEEIADGSAIARPHIADAMVKRKLVTSFEEAFCKYISNQGPAYVPKVSLKPREAIELIHLAGGVVVIAHPIVADMYKRVEELAGMGLDGIEIYHYLHKKQDVKRLKNMADRYGLVPTGGSDFHGRAKREVEIGTLNVPSSFLDELKKRAYQIRGCN